MNLKIGIVIALLAVASVATGAYWYTGTSTITEDETITQTAESEGTSVDCGTMGSLTFSGALDFDRDFDANAQQVWTCMTEALAECSPAYAVIGENRYEIIGKDGNLCNVSGPSYDIMASDPEAQQVTCQMSDELIRYSYEMVSETLPGNTFAPAFQVMSIITGGGGTLDLPNGTSETVLCS